MEHNFEYRQSLRVERLQARQRAAKMKRVRLLSFVFTFLFLTISVVCANSIIAKAGEGNEKSYQKQYMTIKIEKGDTVWSIAEEHITPGFDTITDLIEEISFINSLDDNYSVQSGKFLMIPYYAEI